MATRTSIAFEDIVGSPPATWAVVTAGAGPQGRLPLTAEMLLDGERLAMRSG